MGSATTQAVAHKMNRKYIGIEQMDYIENLSVNRIKKVIEGEQGGISKELNWQGGGSFVYCELKEDGKSLIFEIEKATEKDINQIKEKVYSDERIVPYIMADELKKIDKEFNNLTLKDKKKALIRLVDKNKLYVNYSDIDDKNIEVTDDEREFTKSFYEKL